MYNYDRGSRGGLAFNLGLRGAVLMLLAWNGIIYLLQLILPQVLGLHVDVATRMGFLRLDALTWYLGLRPDAVWHGWIWQPITYMFLHGSLWHILFNMLALWMFGSQLESDWGTRTFICYYFFTGIGAGLTNAVVFPHEFMPTVGASGAIYGLLLAYGISYPDRPIYLYFFIRMPAKYLVVLFAIIELFLGFTGLRGGIAHFAHLGGLLFGLIYLWLWGFPGGRLGYLRRRRLARRRPTFQVVDFRSPGDRR